jgi:SRSO17 transposase
VANCQASVVACCARARGYTLVDRRLYLPEHWFSEAFRPRREGCGIPAATGFRTRPELAVEMVAALRERGALPFRWVLADEHFGLSTPFLDRVAALGPRYFAEAPHDTRVWLRRPATAVPPPKKHGHPTHRRRSCRPPHGSAGWCSKGRGGHGWTSTRCAAGPAGTTTPR